MAENSPDISKELAKSGVKLRDLNAPENAAVKQGLLNEILGNFSRLKQDGETQITELQDKESLTAALEGLKSGVTNSRSEIDFQTIGIIQKINGAVPNDYKEAEQHATDLLNKGILASENGYISQVMRQQYEQVAHQMGWEGKSKTGETAKSYLESRLKETPKMRDNLISNLSTLPENSPLNGTHTADALAHKMKEKWGLTPAPEMAEKEKAATGQKVVEGILGEQQFVLTDLEDNKVDSKKFNSEKYRPWLEKMQESYVSNLASHEKVVSDQPDYQTKTTEVVAKSLLDLGGDDGNSARFAADLVFGNGFSRDFGSADRDTNQDMIGLNMAVTCPDGRTHFLVGELSEEIKKKTLAELFAVHKQLSESPALKSLTENDIKAINTWVSKDGNDLSGADASVDTISQAIKELSGASITIKQAYEDAILSLVPANNEESWRKEIVDPKTESGYWLSHESWTAMDKLLSKFATKNNVKLQNFSFDLTGEKAQSIGDKIWAQLRERAKLTV